ncbi:MAG: UDP-N-acetylmuramate dehydrogenase [Candidatus Saccharimonadales bacterium]
MPFLTDVSLHDYSTMRLGGRAAYLTEIHSHSELTETLHWAQRQQLPVIMIGDGSNIVWRDEGCNGLILVNKIMHYEVFDEDGTNFYVTIGAGENWDGVVSKMVEAGLSGTETLSLIPGTTGATPIQNVGAYGQEISDTLVSVEAYDTVTRSLVNIPNSDCIFGYRTSRFKTSDKGRFYITAITLHLMKANLQPPFYSSLQNYLSEHKITNFTPAIIRKAIIDIRSHKLPNPSNIANTGSFFENPIVDEGTMTQIASSYDTIPNWRVDDSKVKLSAAWLIEQAGFKNFHDSQTGMATWPNSALIFINEQAKSTADLMKFKQKVVDAVKAKFDVTLEQEPELLP